MPLAHVRFLGLFTAVLALTACGPSDNEAQGESRVLSGFVRGPVGAEVTLEANGVQQKVTLVRSAGNTDDYDATPFSMTIANGTSYTLTATAISPMQVCVVYSGATGTLPQTRVLVGCENRYDLISRSTDDAIKGTYFDSQSPSIGGSRDALGDTGVGYGEGRFTAFVSYANGLATNATSAHRQIFWRDALTGETQLVSKNAAGVEGNGDSWAPVLSADGTVVVFESYATDLVPNDTNGTRDVFMWSALANAVSRVSVSMAGTDANGASYEPTVSADGKVIAFTSAATNLTTTPLGLSTLNVFRVDVKAGTTTMLSVTPSNVGAGGSNPAISEDGQRVAFWSFASNIVSGDTNDLWDIFLFDYPTQKITRVSVTSTGNERNQGDESSSRVVAPAISGNGRFVAFATTATNMVPGDTNNFQDVFVVDTQNNSVTRASVGSAGEQGNAHSPLGQGERPALSYDGTWVAFSTASSNLGAAMGTSGISNVLMHNRTSGETRVLSNQMTGSVGPPSISRTGAFVVFGAANPLDGRFASSGLFTHFTGAGLSWWWVE